MTKKLTSNPFKEGSQAWIFCEIAEVDYSNGFSNIVPWYKLLEYGLVQEVGGNGCGWGRSDGPLGAKFNINRKLEGGRVVSIQLIGFAKNNFTGKIDKEVINALKSQRCRILDVGGRNIEVDHKDGRKDDYSLHDNQTLEDFQPLHKSANVAKRYHCSACKESGIRYDATKKGYSVAQYLGTLKYSGSCIGCYWYDPMEFNRQVSRNFVKTR